MHEVTVHKAELLDKLKENRKQHHTEYTAASIRYNKAFKKVLEGKLQELENNQVPDKVINLPTPENHTAEYDQVITMVKMSVDSELTLSSTEFAQFVMDNWSWKQAVTRTNAFYGV